MDVVLWWHLHQPDYREPGGSSAWFPWVRMHALRAYTDLPAFVESSGLAGMTINIVPSLADQLVDLATGRVEDRHHRIARHLAEGDDSLVREAFFAHAVPAPVPIRAVPHLDELREKARHRLEPTPQDALDACVLFHLTWVGFTLGEDPVIRELFERGRDFSRKDVHEVLRLSRATAGEVLPRLKRVREQGLLHLSSTPYMHPILPLLVDTQVAKEATHDGGAPRPFSAVDDARAHVEDAIARHLELFGEKPAAMWPAEGALSEGALDVFHEAGVQVLASDEDLLRKSLGADDRDAHLRPWRHERTGVRLLFRDRALSDDWGFVYRDLPAAHAAEAFVGGCEKRGERGPLCPVILDGENPFERFPLAGKTHLEAFAKAAKGRLRFLSPLEATEGATSKLPRMATGSWINANLDIWAGDDEDRRAWDLLATVRDHVVLDLVGEECRKTVRTHLFAAEGSDWFWWFGPEFSIPDKAGFDGLFRQHLAAAVKAAGIDPDALPRLDVPISSSEGGAHARHVLPLGIDARRSHLDSALPWANSLRIAGSSDGGSMHRGSPLIEDARVLLSHRELLVLAAVRDDVDSVTLDVSAPGGEKSRETPTYHAAGRRWARFTLSWEEAGVGPEQPINLSLTARAGQLFERVPDENDVIVNRPQPTYYEA